MKTAGCNCIPRRYGPTQSKALVCEYEDGSVEAYYRGERIRFHEIAEPVREVAEPRLRAASIRVRRKAKPDHPRRLGYETRVAMRTPLASPPRCAGSFRFALKSRATLQRAAQRK